MRGAGSWVQVPRGKQHGMIPRAEHEQARLCLCRHPAQQVPCNAATSGGSCDVGEPGVSLQVHSGPASLVGAPAQCGAVPVLVAALALRAQVVQPVAVVGATAQALARGAAGGPPLGVKAAKAPPATRWSRRVGWGCSCSQLVAGGLGLPAGSLLGGRCSGEVLAVQKS